MTSRFLLGSMVMVLLLFACGGGEDEAAGSEMPTDNDVTGGTVVDPNASGSNALGAGRYRLSMGDLTVQFAFAADADGAVAFLEGEYEKKSGNETTMCALSKTLSAIDVTTTENVKTQVDVELRSTALKNACNFEKLLAVFDGTGLTSENPATGTVAIDDGTAETLTLTFAPADAPWTETTPGFLPACFHECEVVAGERANCDARNYTKPLFRCRERCENEQAAFSSPACEAATLERTRCSLRQPDRCAFRATTDACSAEQQAVQDEC